MADHFIIRIDQKSLKWLLQQKISTPFQQFWLSKFMGFNYDIQYKSGKENLVTNALSRVPSAKIMCMSISLIQTYLFELIKDSYKLDAQLLIIIEKLRQNQHDYPFKLHNDLLIRHNKIVLGPDDNLEAKIIQWHHNTLEAGHSGRDLTLKRVNNLFYWKMMTNTVIKFVRSCVTCQASKYDTTVSPGLLQPSPMPEEVWLDISMDFMPGLPKSNGKDVILVVVDRLNKYAHFVALAHPYSAVTVAQAYLENIFKLYGWPQTIVSDRDAAFLSQFWRSLLTLHGNDVLFSSAYHPETDGQTEIVNRCLETYLRCMCCDNPHEWSSWLPLAEWWYNTHFHSATQLTPYEIV